MVGCLSAMALLAAIPAFAQSLTIQGKVLDGSNNPVSGSATIFRVQITAPDSARCVLFDETHTVNLSGTGGFFSINLADGAGTQNAPTTYTLEQALSNRAAFSINSSYCASGSGTLAYSPGVNDNRKVVIQFRDPGTMSGFETIPEMDLNPVAWAMEARSVGGFPAGSLLRVVGGGVPGTAPALTPAEITELQALVAGTSLKYIARDSSGGAKLPSYPGSPSSPTSGSVWFDSSGSGSIKYVDSSGATQTLGAGGGGGGTITGITASGALTGGGSSGAVTISLPTTGVTGFGSAVGSASAVPVITYDSYGRLTSVTTAAISGTLPTGTSGQFLKSSGGSSWAGAGILMGDLKNSVGSLPLFGTVNCTASQSMYWDSGADQIRCQNIAVGNAQISDLAWSKLTGVPNLVANAGGTPSLLTDTETNLPTVHVAGRIFIASDTKKIFRDNGTTWDELAPGSGGTLTGVLAGAGISVSGTGATRTVALDNTGKAAGTFYKVTTDADGRVSSGAGALVAGDIPNLDWSKISSGKPTTITGYAADAVVNALNTASFATGPTSAQPTGHTAGRVFIDTTLQKIQYDNGSAWIDVASNGGSGFSGSLSGEITGTQSATQVNNIAGITRSTITTNLNAVSNATDAATASQLVKRDANGDFAGRKITSGEVIVKGTTHTASFTAEPTADYSLKLPDAKASVNGQVLSSDTNGVLSWITPASGTISVAAPVTNTSGTIGMPSANTSRDGYLTQGDWNTFSGKLSSALNSALIWVGNGSNVAAPVSPSGNVSLDNAGKFTVTGIRDQAISGAGTSVGQILRYSATDTWTPQFLTMKDLRSTVTGTQALTSSCTAGKTLYWDSATDSLGCQDISISAATQLSGILPVANGGTGTATGSITGTGALAFTAGGSNQNVSLTPSGTGYTLLGGKVGIGTTAPSSALSIAVPEISSGRESLMTFRMTGDANTVGGIGNLTSANGAFGPMFFGYRPGSFDRMVTSFRGFTDSAGDVAGTENALVDISGVITDNNSDPINGNQWVPSNRNIFSVSSWDGPLMSVSPTGRVGIGSFTPSTSLDLSQKKDALSLPRGTTGEAPAATVAGRIRWNSSNAALEVSNGSAWVSVLAGNAYSFSTGTTGNAPNWSNMGNAYSLNIPLASSGAGVTAGLLSYAEYTAKAPLASPTFTGTPAAPTAAADTNTTQLATTAYVLGQAASATPLMNGTGAVGTSLKYARGDHVHPTDTSRAPAGGSNSINTVGTITSGTWNGSTIDVARGGTGLTSGTTNGVPYFDSSSTMAATGAGTLGQVLTANASGVPTWQTPPAGVPAVGFYAYGSNQNVATVTSTTVINPTVVYDLTGAYNPATGVFTAPSSGVYNCSAVTDYETLGGTATAPIDLIGSLQATGGTAPVNGSRSPCGSQFCTSTASHNIYLTAGGTVKSVTYHGAGSTKPLYGSKTNFSCVLVSPGPAGGTSQWVTNSGNIYYDSGRVGIGTTSPTWPFQVDKTSSANGGGWSAYFREPNAGGVLIGSRGASTAAAVGTIMGTDSANTTFGPLSLNPFGGNVGIGSSAPSTALDVAGNIKANYLTIRPESAGSGEGGQLTLMGATGYNDAHFDLLNRRFRYHSGYAGEVFAVALDTGNVTASGTITGSSDQRLKKNIEGLKGSLDKVLRLRGVTYEWSKKGGEAGKQIGVIAQEVEKIYPELVRTDEKGWKSVAYMNLVSPLIEAMKEFHKLWRDDSNALHDDIARMNRELASVRAENKAKDDELKAMKAYLCAKDPAAPICKNAK